MHTNALRISHIAAAAAAAVGMRSCAMRGMHAFIKTGTCTRKAYSRHVCIIHTILTQHRIFKQYAPPPMHTQIRIHMNILYLISSAVSFSVVSVSLVVLYFNNVRHDTRSYAANNARREHSPHAKLHNKHRTPEKIHNTQH